MTTYVTGGHVEKLVNVAHADLVQIQQSPTPTQTAAPYQLPSDIADFTGRQEQIDHATRLLQQRSEAVPILAIAGMGGVGKSSLAIHIAHRMREQFPDAQLYIDLRGAEKPIDPSEALRSLLKGLGVEDQSISSSLPDQARHFRSVLSDKRALVLLDNANDEAQVRSLLPGSPGCAVLITSRKSLSALEGVTVTNLEVLSKQDALILLQRLIRAERIAEWQENQRAADRIVQLCGRLPLALRIAAGKLSDKPHWTLDEYAKQLTDEQSRVRKFELGDLEVRSVFALSYRDLTTEDGHLFRLLGALDAAAFFLVSAAAIWQKPLGIAIDVLERLIDAKLIEPKGRATQGWVGATAYRIHDLIRLFATEEIRARITNADLSSARQRGDKGRTLNGLHTFAFIKAIEKNESSWKEALRSYEKMIRVQRRLRISDDRSEGEIWKDMVGIYVRLGIQSGENGQLPEAIQHLERATRLSGRSGLPNQSILMSVVAQLKAGNTQEALEKLRGEVLSLDPSFAMHRKLAFIQTFLARYEDREKLIRSIPNQVVKLAEDKEFDQAMELLEEHEQLIKDQESLQKAVGVVSPRVDDEDGSKYRARNLVINYVLRTRILGYQGLFEQATEYLRRGLESASQLGDDFNQLMEKTGKTWLAESYARYGGEAWNKNNLVQAKQYVHSSLDLFRQLNDLDKVALLEDALRQLDDHTNL